LGAVAGALEGGVAGPCAINTAGKKNNKTRISPD